VGVRKRSETPFLKHVATESRGGGSGAWKRANLGWQKKYTTPPKHKKNQTPKKKTTKQPTKKKKNQKTKKKKKKTPTPHKTTNPQSTRKKTDDKQKDVIPVKIGNGIWLQSSEQEA